MVLRLALVLLVVGLVVVAVIVLSGRGRRESRPETRPEIGAARWVVNHYDIRGEDARSETRVVVQKLSPTGAHLLSEHVVATIRTDDPEYDAAFLEAMSSARERRALFESEQG